MIADVARRFHVGGKNLLPISDDFSAVHSDLNGSLTSDGKATWEKVLGAGGSLISSNGSVAQGNSTNNTVYVVDIGSSTKPYVASLDLLNPSSTGGDCLYFRVADYNNWWRLRYFQSTEIYYSGGSSTTYYDHSFATWYTIENPPGEACTSHDHRTYKTVTTLSSTKPSTPYFPTYISHTHGLCGPETHGHYSWEYGRYEGYTTRTVTGPGSWVSYGQSRVYLERMVDGSLSVIGTSTASSPQGLRATVSPTDIVAQYRDSGGTMRSVGSGTYSTLIHSEASKVGIGRGQSEFWRTGSNMDNFQVALAT